VEINTPSQALTAVVQSSEVHILLNTKSSTEIRKPSTFIILASRCLIPVYVELAVLNLVPTVAAMGKCWQGQPSANMLHAVGHKQQQAWMAESFGL